MKGVFERIRGCRSCGSSRLATLLTLGFTPLTDAYLMAGQEAGEWMVPLTLMFCSACSLVQIEETVPPEAMFGDYQYYSSFSNTLLEHSRRHVDELIGTRALGSNSLVVELASNDGYLLKNFVEQGVPVLGIDPASGPAEAAEANGVPTLVEFFGRDVAQRLRAEGKAADVIIANNVLAHVADLNGFVAGIATLLKEDGVATIEAPYVRDLIEELEFDTIYHEHLCYYSVSAVDVLAARHGLILQDVRHLPIHGGSMRYYLGHAPERSATVERYLEEERAAGMLNLGYYERFAENVDQLQGKLRDLLGGLKQEGARIAAYGAAAKGTILLNSSRIGRETIDFVVDRNTHKQGLLLPGVHLPIRDPSVLVEEMPDYTVVLAWNFSEEIMREQDEYRRRGGRFVIPIPDPRVVA